MGAGAGGCGTGGCPYPARWPYPADDWPCTGGGGSVGGRGKLGGHGKLGGTGKPGGAGGRGACSDQPGADGAAGGAAGGWLYAVAWFSTWFVCVRTGTAGGSYSSSGSYARVAYASCVGASDCTAYDGELCSAGGTYGIDLDGVRYSSDVEAPIAGEACGSVLDGVCDGGSLLAGVEALIDATGATGSAGAGAGRLSPCANCKNAA